MSGESWEVDLLYTTVQRYAHLNSQQLQEAAERISGTKLVHTVQTDIQEKLAG